jgi:hypothetical protein
MIAMGGGELFELTDQNSLHRGIEFPGHHHASLYNVARMEPMVRRFLPPGVTSSEARITDVEAADGHSGGWPSGRNPRFDGDVRRRTGTAVPRN